MDPLMKALRDLNEAAYAAIKAAKDRDKYPDINRVALFNLSRMTDALVDSNGKDAA